MLQIISGKFFKSDNRHVFKGKGILYSNFSWVGPIETCVATLEPVDSYREVSSYVLLYNNQIEKDGALVRIGDAGILDQFQLLATFGLRAYFSPFRDEVSQICRKSSSGATDIYVPSQFIHRFFQPGINGNQQEISNFIEIVKKVIGLKREVYNSVVSSLKTFRDALLASNYNLDLSYSMLIYCLEALAQGFDNHLIKWEDYDQTQRDQLEKILKFIKSEYASDIRTVLLSSANLKLRKRFISFILNYIEDSFYLDEAENINIPLRKSHLERALNNAYVMRSKYVHELIPILHQLRVPAISRMDVFTWEGEPYLTISGLLRLVLHVINNFIRKSESIEKEDLNWRKELPGIVTMKLAPQYWVWKTEGFEPGDAATKFSGFLSQVYAALSNNEALTDLRTLLEVFETKLPQAKQAHKITMLAMYWLYNSIVKEEARRPNWEKFLEIYSKEFLTCSIEMMIVRSILSQELPWPLEECISILKDFNEKRFYKGNLEIPLMIEIALLVTISNYALNTDNYDDRIRFLKTAINEASGHFTIQQLLLNSLENKEVLDISKILGIKEQTTQKR
jgi:hypothetical protein